MIYIRDNNGPYYDRVVDYIHSDKPEALVLALLLIKDQKGRRAHQTCEPRPRSA